ncbi:hypothetical protein [uncultured Alistipes sp.]|jgi:hypothetical protein|uniref:hypothetical protein n=1 Tax=uncultured Alistipes sp. TaxID=538949 RepID=UPI002630A03A|nr:hypothetical protein [uncultured Alistipes sp.]
MNLVFIAFGFLCKVFQGVNLMQTAGGYPPGADFFRPPLLIAMILCGGRTFRTAGLRAGSQVRRP